MKLQQIKMTIPRCNKKKVYRAAVTVMPEKHDKPVRQMLVKMLVKLPVLWQFFIFFRSSLRSRKLLPICNINKYLSINICQ